jgi:hypothetical protein
MNRAGFANLEIGDLHENRRGKIGSIFPPLGLTRVQPSGQPHSHTHTRGCALLHYTGFQSRLMLGTASIRLRTTRTDVLREIWFRSLILFSKSFGVSPKISKWAFSF